MSQKSSAITSRSSDHRRQEAISMAMSGATYDQIATTLGYANRSGPWKAVNEALKARTAQTVDDYRTLELSRLDALQSFVWSDAMGGSIPAVNTCLKVIGLRAKLLGLNVPPEVRDEVRTVVASPEHYARDMKRIALNDPTAEL